MPRKNRRLIYSGNGDAYYVSPSAIGSSELSVTTPEVFVTADPDDVARGNAQRWWKEHSNVYGEKGLEQVSPEFDLISLAPLVEPIVNNISKNVVKKLIKRTSKLLKSVEDNPYSYKSVDNKFLKYLYNQKISGKGYDFVDNGFSSEVTKGLNNIAKEDLIHNTIERNAKFFRDNGVPDELIIGYKDKANRLLDDVNVGRYSGIDYKNAGMEETGGFYDNARNFISVNRGSKFPANFVEKHEGRHLLDYKLDDGIVSGDYITGSVLDDWNKFVDYRNLQLAKQKQNMILGDAYDNNFLSIPNTKYAGSLEGYPNMAREAVTTNRDARDVLFNRSGFNNAPIEEQNRLIDIVDDDEIISAIESANGYGRRYIDLLEDSNLLTPNKIKQFRKAMKYVGINALPLGIGLTGYGLNQKRLGGRVKLADGGYVRKRNNTDLFSFQGVANLVDKRRNLINDTVSVKKQPTATPYKPKTNIETGFKTNKNQEVYTVQKGDTLGTISQRYYGNSKKYLDIASANNIKNPDKIEVGDKLVIPKKFDKPLTLKEIPTNNRVSIIDDYSPNYNYIVEGNKIYYSRKGHNDYWVDISDNETARKNLFNHIGTKYNYKGYEDNEMDIGKAVQTGTYDYDKMFQSRKNYNIPEFNPDYSVPVSSIARRNVLIGKQNVNHRNDKPSTTIFDSLSNFFNKGINYVGRQYRKIFGSNEDSSRLELPNQQSTSSAYGIMPASYTGDTINIDNRYIIPESINLNDVRLGTRNRGNVTPINTEGAIITNFNPYQQYSEINKNDKTSTYMGIDKNGKFKVGNIDSFSDGDLLTKTFANDVISFDTQNGKQVWKDDSKHGNRGRSVPVVNVLDKNGNIVKGTINILTNKNSDKSNTYGWVTGGRVILEVGNERRLVSGSIDDIKKQFNDIKKRHNAKSVRIYTLDNGSYNRGLRTKNRLLTSADLKAYDNMNSGGGNFMYIKSGSDVYSTDTVKTPNIRTKNSESYRKGHSDVNERKGVVLHHTAFMDNDLASVTKHLTDTKSEASSHVVIGFDGHRRVLATPDKVTFHAGNSVWNNRENVNDFMIGIEFQGDTNKKNLTDRQIQSAIEYLKPIIRENNISLENIVTHQQVRDMYNKYARQQGKPGAASKPDINFENYKRIITELRKQLYYDKNVKREKKRYGGKVRLLYAYN